MMRKNTWRTFATYWWGLPMICGLIMIPLSSWLSPSVMLEQGRTYFIYLPLAACVALLMVYDWRAFPGITTALLIRYVDKNGPETGVIVTLIFLFTLSVCWMGYRAYTQNRWSVSIGLMKMVKPRLIWLVGLMGTFFVLLLQLVIGLGLLPNEVGVSVDQSFNLPALINYQAVLIGCMSSMQLFYYILRIIRQPHFAIVLLQRMKRDMAPNVTKNEIRLWFSLLILFVVLLSWPRQDPDTANILLSDYTLTLLLPLMLYGAMRFSYHLVCLTWGVTLIVLFYNYQEFVEWSNLEHNLVFITSLLLVFTLCIYLMATVTSRQRDLSEKTSKASLLDPVLVLPNLRALQRDLAHYPRSIICFIRIPELDMLSRNYGMQWRIEFKQRLASTLRQHLGGTEDIYHLPGYDLVLRIECDQAEERVNDLYKITQSFRMIWNGFPIHPQFGFSWCMVLPPVMHLHMLLGELSTIAEISLTSGRPESTLQVNSHVQSEIKAKVSMLHRIQSALDGDNFVLMAQPIQGIRGDSYHEILLRMPDSNGNLLSPNSFLPVVHEFGLAYQLDLWVLTHTLKFMRQNRDTLPGCRFAVNLSPSSLCRPGFSHLVHQLLQEHEVEPFQLVFEVTESHLLHNIKYAEMALIELRNLGCRIAIDDFGTGYASYSRLKEIQADIVKIDGSFVRNMLTNPIDAQIVRSICQVARLKHLSIVAEYVEYEEQREALKLQGVDYMQGYLIGKPQPLATLLSARTEVKPIVGSDDVSL
jgi:EAL domain-containing protein (putative c-di-GMP-specific phosphodiesterase class I)/GGDEF domain-containing protein